MSHRWVLCTHNSPEEPGQHPAPSVPAAPVPRGEQWHFAGMLWTECGGPWRGFGVGQGLGAGQHQGAAPLPTDPYTAGPSPMLSSGLGVFFPLLLLDPPPFSPMDPLAQEAFFLLLIAIESQ